LYEKNGRTQKRARGKGQRARQNADKKLFTSHFSLFTFGGATVTIIMVNDEII
jgi:hypothetical protein